MRIRQNRNSVVFFILRGKMGRTWRGLEKCASAGFFEFLEREGVPSF